MTATDTDLDALLDALAERAKARAVDRPLYNQAGDEVTPLASTGRLVVHPGDVIASVWGNTTYDQTVQAYDTNAARDSQWPTPKDGAVAYTLDTGSLWVRRAGAWKALPLGYIASIRGPATAVVCGTTTTTILSLTAAMTAGRRYRITAQVFGQQSATASAVTYATITDTAGNLPAGYRIMTVNALPANAFASGGFVWDFTAPTTGTDTITLAGISTTTGTFTATANFSQISLEDIGT